jgi:hypothetical protein
LHRFQSVWRVERYPSSARFPTVCTYCIDIRDRDGAHRMTRSARPRQHTRFVPRIARTQPGDGRRHDFPPALRWNIHGHGC